VYLAIEGGGAGYIQDGRVLRDAGIGSSRQQGPIVLSSESSESSERVNEVRVGAVTGVSHSFGYVIFMS
jgi:hypothetical protein